MGEVPLYASRYPGEREVVFFLTEKDEDQERPKETEGPLSPHPSAISTQLLPLAREEGGRVGHGLWGWRERECFIDNLLVRIHRIV